MNAGVFRYQSETCTAGSDPAGRWWSSEASSSFDAVHKAVDGGLLQSPIKAAAGVDGDI